MALRFYPVTDYCTAGSVDFSNEPQLTDAPISCMLLWVWCYIRKKTVEKREEMLYYKIGFIFVDRSFAVL